MTFLRDIVELEGLRAKESYFSTFLTDFPPPSIQAFCRLSAVFGATYFLGRPLDGVVVDNNGGGRAVAVAFNGKRIGFKHMVADSRLFPENRKEVRSSWRVRRKVCLLEDSVMPAEKEQLTFVSLPPVADGKGTWNNSISTTLRLCLLLKN